MNRYIGVDGCKAGWFFVCLGPEEEIIFGDFSTIEKLWQQYGNSATSILVDIPIGLPSEDNPTRRCDTEARRILGPKRQSSIFPPPCREALNTGSYQAACQVNQEITGRKISRQAWGIAPKIREMDEFLRQYPEALKCIRETHPEVCFWALNSGKAMPHSKKSEKGFEGRLDILKSRLPKSGAVVKAALGRYLRKNVTRDDVLDALILALTGFVAGGKLSAVPEVPEEDASGLTMEMVYCPVKVEPEPETRKSVERPIIEREDFSMNGNSKGKLLPNADTHNCFACSPKNPHGLKMKFYCSENSVYSWVSVPAYLCGWNETIHGGIISTILDEVMGWAGIYFLKKVTLTKLITVEFIKALKVGDRLKAAARVTKKEGKREAVIEGCIYNGKDELCAKAEGTFMLLSTDVAKRLGILNDEQVQTFFEPLIG